MKNLMIAAVLSLGTMTAFAQEEETAVEETATEVSSEATEAANEVSEEATEAANEVSEEANEMQDGFNEVATEEVPEAITTALEEAHPGATIDKAFINDQSQYKLKVTTEDGESSELYADAEGNWIEM